MCLAHVRCGVGKLPGIYTYVLQSHKHSDEPLIAQIVFTNGFHDLQSLISICSKSHIDTYSGSICHAGRDMCQCLSSHTPAHQPAQFAMQVVVTMTCAAPLFCRADCPQMYWRVPSHRHSDEPLFVQIVFTKGFHDLQSLISICFKSHAGTSFGSICHASCGVGVNTSSSHTPVRHSS
jgi:hypothetical protein